MRQVFVESIEKVKGRRKNILILGGTRFFGKEAVNELLSKGHTVTIATGVLHLIILGIVFRELFMTEHLATVL